MEAPERVRGMRRRREPRGQPHFVLPPKWKEAETVALFLALVASTTASAQVQAPPQWRALAGTLPAAEVMARAAQAVAAYRVRLSIQRKADGHSGEGAGRYQNVLPDCDVWTRCAARLCQSMARPMRDLHDLG